MPHDQRNQHRTGDRKQQLDGTDPSPQARATCAIDNVWPAPNVLARLRRHAIHIPALSASDAMALPPIRLVGIERVRDITGRSESGVRELIAQGLLPAPIKSGSSRRAAARWVEAEIFAYVWSLVAQRTHCATDETLASALSEDSSAQPTRRPRATVRRKRGGPA